MTLPAAFMSFSVGELAMIAVVALLVFGGRLPEVMRNAGRAYARLRKSMDDLANPLREEMRRLDVRDAAKPFPRRPDTDRPLPETNPPPGVYNIEDDIGDEPEVPSQEPEVPRQDPPAPSPAASEPPPVPKRKPDAIRGTAADEPPPV